MTTIESRKPLHVLKASAGAGKTHRLTNEYIDLLLGPKDCALEERPSEDKYQHILAVTFTNKATDEMKTRILGALYEISKDSSDPRKDFAENVLTKILHDYSLFSVSTIDTFFQKTMRAFAREIGEYSSYKVEINNKDVIDSAVDLMMSNLDEDSSSDLLQWLIEYSYDQIEDGKNWDIESKLQNLAELFMREDFKIKKDKAGFTTSREKIRDFKKKLIVIIKSFEKSAKELGEEGLKIMADHGLEPMDYAGKSRSPLLVFEKLSKGIISEDKVITKSLQECYNDVSCWSAKTADPSTVSKIQLSYEDGLNDLIGNIIDLYRDKYKEYITAGIYRENLNILGIFSDLYQIMKDLLKQNNSVLLSETTDVLNRIIDQDDAPFIYEKIGTHYDNYMLDEFQDTSDMQWDNLLPLVRNSVSNNDKNLIVGDVKQSIYRFRNSDWKLLDSEIKKQFGESMSAEDMKDNWRSLSNIIDFNNDLFAPSDAQRQSVGSIIATAEPEIGKRIDAIYDGTVQYVPEERKGKQGGYVRLSFVPQDLSADAVQGTMAKNDWQINALSLIPEQIEILKKQGYKMSDMAFLVKKNKEAACVSEFLMNNGYKVMTDEALAVSCSPVIRKTVSFLKWIVNPEDPLNNLTFEEDERLKSISIEGDSLYEVCEKILDVLKSSVLPEEIPFIQTFLDGVLDYSTKNGSSISGYVDWWNSQGYKQSISVPADENAATVMTIHKSKGLGFKIVFIPFLYDAFSVKQDHYIWVNLDEKPFDEIGLVPVNVQSKKKLQSSYLSEDASEEILMTYIDVVNTEYVAFTRPKDALFIYSPLPKGDKSLLSFSEVLYRKFSSLLVDNIYEIGTVPVASKESENAGQQKEFKMTEFISEPIGERLRHSGQAADFFDNDQISPRHRGIILHDILSRINSAEDLDESISFALSNGDISTPEVDKYKLTLSEALSEISERGWFEGKYQNINEISIVDGSGQIFRPDRVLIDKENNRAIVVDYKFGVHKRQYFNQVSNYCSLISDMGYGTVEGYIWYVGDCVEKVA